MKQSYTCLDLKHLKAIAAQFSLPLIRHYGGITGNSRKDSAFLAATTEGRRGICKAVT